MSASEDEPAFEPLRDEAEAMECAHLMATSEPWITLGRSHD